MKNGIFCIVSLVAWLSSTYFDVYKETSALDFDLTTRGAFFSSTPNAHPFDFTFVADLLEINDDEAGNSLKDKFAFGKIAVNFFSPANSFLFERFFKTIWFDTYFPHCFLAHFTSLRVFRL
jgi:hypothetical protein